MQKVKVASFRDRYRNLGELARELTIVREHNLRFKKWEPGYLFFSQGLLVLLTMERFLRVILGPKAKDTDTLPNLLEMATSKALNLISLPPVWTREQTIKAIKDVRNVLMHGNYEQAAKQSCSADPTDYFRSSAYINEVETLTKILNHIMDQIDPETGQPKAAQAAHPAAGGR